MQLNKTDSTHIAPTPFKLLLVTFLSVFIVLGAFAGAIYAVNNIHKIVVSKEIETHADILRNAEISNQLSYLEAGHDQFIGLLRKPANLQTEINRALNRLDLLMSLTDFTSANIHIPYNRSRIKRYQLEMINHFNDYLFLGDGAVQLEEISKGIFSHLDKIEIITGERILDLSLKGQDVIGVSQIYTLIPYCREQLLTAKLLFESAIRELNPDNISRDSADSNTDTLSVTAAISTMRQTLYTLTSAEQAIADEANYILSETERYLAFVKQLTTIITRINNKHEDLSSLNALLQQNLDEVAEQMVILTKSTQNQTQTQLSRASLFIYITFIFVLLASIVSGLILFFINKKLIRSSHNFENINSSLKSVNKKLRNEITDRHRMERTLHQYERIVSSSQEHMAFISKDYRYEAVNDAYLSAHQKRRDEIIGMSISELFGHEIFEKTIKDKFDTVMRGEHIRYEMWFDFTGKGKRCMDVAYYPYFDTDNTVAGLVVNSRDITDRKLAEAELRYAHKMESIGTMAGGIAHDFNNILTGILGYTELTMHEVPKGSKIYNNLKKIETGGRRAADLVRQILAFSRQDEQDMKPLILQSLVKETIKFLRGTLPATIELNQEIDPMCRPILGNATQFYQIIMNLGSNAHHAMRQNGGILSISLKEETIYEQASLTNKFPLPPGNYAHLTLSDTGCGIDPLLVDRIFEPYFTTKDVGEGTGLGLATVHGIVKSHQGHIFVTSNIDEGTSFDIFLPLYIDQRSVENIDEDFVIENLSGRVLFVDDETMIVEAAQQNLSSYGLEVVSFSDSEKALNAFQEKPNSFDIVVTDQMMPKMTGTELAKEILQLRPDLPIILYTGFTGDIDEEQAKKEGIKGFLAKPLDMKTLAQKIQLFLTQT